eukprot:6479260-Amphidinium_carterae.2
MSSVLPHVLSSVNEATPPWDRPCCEDPWKAQMRRSTSSTSSTTTILEEHRSEAPEWQQPDPSLKATQWTYYSYGYYLYWYYYGDAQVYEYGQGEHVSQVCECNQRPKKPWNWTSVLVAMWICSFVVAFCLLRRTDAWLWQSTFRWLAGGVNMIGNLVQGIRADITIVRQAITFLMSEVIFILSRRSPIFKTKLRRTAMRWRPFTPMSVETGEPVRVFSPETVRTPRPLLNEILLDRGVVHGGRRMRRTRLTQIRRKWWRTTYNPQTRGDCLFMPLMRVLRIKETPIAFRRMLQYHASTLLETNESIHRGWSLSSILDQVGIPHEAYIQDLVGTRRRWGNTVDVMVCAHMTRRRLRLTSVTSGRILFESDIDGEPLDIGYTYKHFIAGKYVKKSHHHGQSKIDATWPPLKVSWLAAWVMCTLTPGIPETAALACWMMCTGILIGYSFSCKGSKTQKVGDGKKRIGRAEGLMGHMCNALRWVLSTGTGPGYSFSLSWTRVLRKNMMAAGSLTSKMGRRLSTGSWYGLGYAFSLLKSELDKKDIDAQVFVQGGAPCLLDGTEQVINNPEQLRRRIAHHKANNDCEPRRRPEPIDYWDEDEQFERENALDDLRIIRMLFGDKYPSLLYWKQHIRTPPRHDGAASTLGSVVVQGGMPPKKRPYPFAGIEVTTPPEWQRVNLVFHGSFAPFHYGHVSCLRDAVRLLEQNHLEVCTVVVGTTTAKQLRRKGVESKEFSDPRNRARLIKAVLEDEKLLDIQVEEDGHSASAALAWKYCSDESKSTNVYLMGSDLIKRPSYCTIMVHRVDEGGDVATWFNRNNLSGVCMQTCSIGSSSTATRERFARGEIPEEYKENARRVLGQLLTHPAIVGNFVRQEGHVDDPHPKAKPMPRRRATTPAASSGDVWAGAIEVRAGDTATTTGTPSQQRPPLPRRSGVIDLVGAATMEQTPDERPPLQRRRRNHCTTEQQPRDDVVVVGDGYVPPVTQIPEQNPHPAQAADIQARMSRDGCLKFAHPLYSHLGTFYRNVIVPVCSLCQVRPMTTSRRSHDDHIRVEYTPSPAMQVPFTIFATLEEYMDLRHALGCLPVAYYYIALTIDNFLILDKDKDSSRGIYVRDLFTKAVKQIKERCVAATAVFAVVMYEAHHFVCVLRPVVHDDLPLVSTQVCTAMNNIFREARGRDGRPGQVITFEVDFEKCLMVQGGMNAVVRTQVRSGRRLSTRFVASQEENDPLMSCVAWILDRHGYKAHRGHNAGEHIRTIAQAWARRAHKQQWLCAGSTIFGLAEDEGCEVQEYLEQHWNPLQHQASPDYAVVYAISCAYAIQMFVLKQDGTRADDYTHTSGWGLMQTEKGWTVVTMCTEAEEQLLDEEDDCYCISPTIPFEEVDSGEDMVEDNITYVIGGAHRMADKNKKDNVNKWNCGWLAEILDVYWATILLWLATGAYDIDQTLSLVDASGKSTCYIVLLALSRPFVSWIVTADSPCGPVCFSVSDLAQGHGVVPMFHGSVVRVLRTSWPESDAFVVVVGGAPKLKPKSSAAPKQPAQTVARKSWTCIDSHLTPGEGTMRQKHTPGSIVRSSSQSSKTPEVTSSPVDDSFENLRILSCAGQIPAEEDCVLEAYVLRETAFHIHMMTNSPEAGFRIQHPVGALALDIRRTLARRLKTRLSRLVLMVGTEDGDGGDFPIHDSTVIDALGTLYLTVRAGETATRAPTKKPATSMKRENNCMVDLPAPTNTATVLCTKAKRRTSRKGCTKHQEFNIHHGINTTVADLAKQITAYLKVAHGRCHIYIEEEGKRISLHQELVVDNLQTVLFEINPKESESRNEAGRGKIHKRPASSLPSQRQAGRLGREQPAETDPLGQVDHIRIICVDFAMSLCHPPYPWNMR